MISANMLGYEAIHHQSLYAINDYDRKFIGLGVIPSNFEPKDSYKVRAKQIHVEMESGSSLAHALDATTNALAKMALVEQVQTTEINPYAIELDENGLTGSSLGEDFDASVINALKIQSDQLHKAKLLQLATAKPSWNFVAEDFTRKITELVSEASMHFSQQSRKILLIPEFIGGKLLTSRLPTDRSRSLMDELKDVALHFNISIDQYATPPNMQGDVLLIQHDGLSVFPGSEPRLRRAYEAPNGLTRTRQFLFAVAGFVLNGRGKQLDHIIVHLPVIMSDDEYV
jgi:hypothetical protein